METILVRGHFSIIMLFIGCFFMSPTYAQDFGDDWLGSSWDLEDETPMNSMPMVFELIQIDQEAWDNEIPYGGVVYADTFKYDLQLKRNIANDKRVYFTIFDIQPDGQINAIQGFNRAENYLPAGKADTRQRLNLQIRFQPPYGKETFLTVFSDRPLSYAAEHSTRSSFDLYPEDVLWLLKGEIPLGLVDEVTIQRFDFEIRPKSAIVLDNQKAEIFKDKLQTVEDSLFAEYLRKKEEKTATSSGHDGDGWGDGDGSWGDSGDGGDGSWGDSGGGDEQATEVTETFSIDAPVFDIERSEVPSDQVYINFPLLVMNSPAEPSFDASRGGKSGSTNTKSKGYVVSGNVAALNELENLRVKVEVSRNNEVQESQYIDHWQMKRGAQTLSFECQVMLLPGQNDIEVKAMTGKGYAVKETFNLIYTPDSTTQQAGKDVLILLGVDNYANWPKLSNAVGDAKSVGESLIAHYGIDPKNIYTLYNNQCTKSTIDSLFRYLIHQVGPNDRVIVYFAGHGFYDDLMEEGYWVTQEASKADMSTYLSNSNITRYIKTFKSKHTLFIADACFSGTYYSASRGMTTLNDRLNSDKSRWMFCSGGMEEVADDFNATGHSPFAYYLLQFLNNPPTAQYSVTDISSAVIKNVARNSNQVPVAKPLQNAGDEGGEFVFRFLK